MKRLWFITFCGLVLWVAPTRSLPQAKEDFPSEAIRVVGTMRTHCGIRVQIRQCESQVR